MKINKIYLINIIISIVIAIIAKSINDIFFHCLAIIIQFLICIFFGAELYKTKDNKQMGQDYILSGILILIIGVSTCFSTIKL